MSKRNSTNHLSADAQRTIERTAALRTEFEAMSTEDLRLHLSAYSKAVGMAFSAIAAERYYEKIHAIECIIEERMSAAAAMVEEAFAVEVEQVVATTPDAPVVETIQADVQAAPADALRVRTMRAFYAAAKAAGLNVKDALGMTWALAKYLGCIIPSRADLSSGQWAEALAGLEMGLLAW